MQAAARVATGTSAGRGLGQGARCLASRPNFLPREVLIASAARTPIGSFNGSLKRLPAPKLGALAIAAALRRSRVEPDEVDAVVFGHALPGGCGQNAVRQAALFAEIPPVADCTGVNKACASGLKAVALAAQSVALGLADVAVAGGMESMSQAPYFLRHARFHGYGYGHGALEDMALHDGLWDSVSQCHMGSCSERTAQEMSISRADQDAYAIESYRRAATAWTSGAMDMEVVPISVQNPSQHRTMQAKNKLVSRDDEYAKLSIESVAGLPPLFEEDGTITAANASSLNDGAAAIVLISADRARDLGVQVIARISAFADHAVEPVNFTVAPAGAIHRALQAAGMARVDFHEIHETFATVPLANMQLLDLDHTRVNVNGGAVALGNPIGASGARVLCALLSALAQRNAVTGCASIANGGGGATAMILERLQ